MCRSSAEGGRRCSGRSCGAADARARQARSRARRGLDAAWAAGDPDQVAAAEAKYTAVTGTPPPAPNVVGTFAGQLPATPEPTAPEKPMPKPEPQPSKPEPADAPSGSTEDRVRDAVAKLAAQGEWVGIIDVRKALGDVDHDEVSRALKELARTNPNVHLVPEDNRKALTSEDHAAAVDYSGESQHLIAIEQPRDTSAKDRVQTAGVGNATDDDLAQVLRDPLTPSRTYDEIRAEQKRREQQVVTSPTPSDATPVAETARAESRPPATAEQRVRDVYRELASRPQGWVRLSDVRERLGATLPREEVDKALQAMTRTGRVHLSPDSDRRGLTQVDHDSAVRIGREDNHLLAIEPEDDE
ncbi:DNA-binding protein [Amycolatopsis sp. NBC_01307]|uniref:DNA-binding protein n=1 Tax=Amycolatopsis sp. NBC_01307 TaxID=2903561 RepID=UPI002E161B68|nr:DNA-binding protein [Amycolatopsis sp. NBC_01307]